MVLNSSLDRFPINITKKSFELETNIESGVKVDSERKLQGTSRKD